MISELVGLESSEFGIFTLENRQEKERLRINQYGYIGINTLVPNRFLTVNGTSNFTGDMWLKGINVSTWLYNQTQNSDNTWIIRNNTADFNFNESKLSTIYYNATQVASIVGTIDAGTLADTQHQDGDYDSRTFNFTEEAGSPGLDLRMNFTNIEDFNQGIMRYYTSPLSGANPVIQIWDYNTSTWEDYPTMSESLSFATISQPVFDSLDHIDGGIVQMRIYKESNGNTNNHYYVDWIAISKGFGTPSGEEIDPYSIHRDGSIPLTGNWDVGSYNITNIEKVGIGTATPGTELDVYDVTSSDIRFRTSSVDGRLIADSNGLTLYPTTQHALRLGANNTQNVMVLVDGKVGIGTSAPAYKLEVNDSDKALNVSGMLYANSTWVGVGNPTKASSTYKLDVDGGFRADGSVMFETGSDGNGLLFTAGQTLTFYNGDFTMKSRTTNDIRMGNYTDTDFLVVDGALGYVGIGTASPGAELEIETTSGNAEVWIDAPDNDDAILQLIAGDGEYTQLIHDGGDNIFYLRNRYSGGRLYLGVTDDSFGLHYPIRLYSNIGVFNDANLDYDFRFDDDDGNPLMHWDAANSRVGIGTSVPTSKLNVYDVYTSSTDGYASNFTLSATGDLGSSDEFYGVYSDVYMTTSDTSNTPDAFGFYGDVLIVQSEGNAYGIKLDVDNQDTSGNAYGIYADVNTGDNAYAGYFLANDESADINYGIYSTSSGGTTNYAGYFASGGVRAVDIASGSGTDYVCVDADGDLSSGASCTEFENVEVATKQEGLDLDEFKIINIEEEKYSLSHPIKKLQGEIYNYYYTIQFLDGEIEKTGRIKVPGNMNNETEIFYYLERKIETRREKTLIESSSELIGQRIKFSDINYSSTANPEDEKLINPIEEGI
jgi:hypothetical protein